MGGPLSAWTKREPLEQRPLGWNRTKKSRCNILLHSGQRLRHACTCTGMPSVDYEAVVGTPTHPCPLYATPCFRRVSRTVKLIDPRRMNGGTCWSGSSVQPSMNSTTSSYQTSLTNDGPIGQVPVPDLDSTFHPVQVYCARLFPPPHHSFSFSFLVLSLFCHDSKAMMLNRQLLFLLALGCVLGIFLLTYSRLDSTLGGICAGEGGCLSLGELKEKLSPASPASPASTPSPEESEAGWGRPVSTDRQRPGLAGQTDEEACKDFPDTSNILLVMKTGASEAYSKIPTQSVTMLRCLPDYLIFSDMEQTVAGQHIMDSLDTVLPKAKDDNRDFDLYRRQRDCPVDQETCNKGQDSAKQGWALDKYKNIHMAEKTFALRPAYQWYLFVDADTYVFWPNMVRWLKRIDHTKKHYLGSAAMLGGFPFAHGGSGYLMSSALMRGMFEGKENVANKWDQEAPKTCCGDYLLARAVDNSTKLRVKNVVSYAYPHVRSTVLGIPMRNMERQTNGWTY